MVGAPLLSGMELATALIWLLRILLPIVLFWIYFKSQTKDDSGAAPRGGPAVGFISKRRLLACRAAVLPDEPAPRGLQTIGLKDATEAPDIFAGTPARLNRGSRREAAGAPRPRRERPEGERRPRRGDGGGITVAAEAAQAASAEAQAKLHLESLVNYVAFNRKEQLRHFMMDEAAVPPPPPSKQRRSAAAPMHTPASEASVKANNEAQIVLNGAWRFMRVDVARSLLEQLTESEVSISDETFALMIQTALAARDLKSASDFLMEMETSGGCPDSGLLDKVMDLYSQQKSKRDQERQSAEQHTTTLLGAFEPQVMMDYAPIEEYFSRTKLSSAATAFVPLGFGTDDESGEGEVTTSTELAPAKEPQLPQAANINFPVVPSSQERIRLKSSAAAFVPRGVGSDEELGG